MNYLKQLLIVAFFLSGTIFAMNEYYVSAMNAYASGNYKQALEWFETAIQKEPSLESYDPFMKLKMGICAFATGDFQRARTYLRSYQGNATAEKILQLIDQENEPTEEWMVWIRSKTPETTSLATPAEFTRSSTSVFLLVGIFVLSFSATFLVMYLLKHRFKIIKEKKEHSSEKSLEEVIESNINEIEKLVQEINPAEEEKYEQSDEELKKIEAQLDSIVQEILAKEKPKVPERQPISDENPFEILKKLEEKNNYDEEDAKVLSDLMQKIVSNQEKSQDEKEL